jgi:hypothetical protein
MKTTTFITSINFKLVVPFEFPYTDRMKNKEQQDQLERYTKTGELIGKKIVCNSCSYPITCFGSNLEGKIKKFGSIENLIETFTCRKCVSASKPKKIVIKATKVSRKEKIAEKTVDIPKMIFKEKRNVLLSEAPDLIESVSRNGSCIRPDIYLNNDRHCDGCSLYTSCLASIKNLSKGYSLV